MEYRQLGKSGLSVSTIGFGCMSLEEEQATVDSLLHKAIDTGINFFDTADLYQHGRNEERVGKALKGKRNNIILATKVGNQWRPDGSGWDWNPKKDYILEAVNNSLKRLKTDYIDLYQLHGGTINDPIDEVIEAFELLQQQGKIRYYGISSIRPNVIREYVHRSRVTSIMIQYSVLDRRPEEECLPLLQQRQIGVLARGPLAKGLLAGKSPAKYLNYSEEEVKKAGIAVKNVSANGKSLSHTAIEFVLSHPAITLALAGIRTDEQLNDLEVLSPFRKLTKEEKKILDESITANLYEEHR